jgi:putative ABC transport system permease protein
LRSLRASYDKDINERDPWRWLVYLLIASFVIGFTLLEVGTNWETLFFPLSIGVGLLMLTGTAALLKWAVKKFFPVRWSYVWRQGIANLYRPSNQTLLLLVSVGLGTALISNLFFVRELLLQQVEKTTSGNQPNILLFDVQQAQVQDVKSTIDSFNMPLMRHISIANLKLVTLNNDSISTLVQDSTDEIETDYLVREYQVSYRDTLLEKEKIISGKWHYKKPKDGKIYVSLQEETAERLNLKVGDSLEFVGNDKRLNAYVGSIRTHKEEIFNPNFQFIFPTGTLDSFPQLNIMLTQADSVQQSVRFQQALVWKVPNVTVIDFGQVLKTLDGLLEKISFVIRFMALFSILTGIIVLISSVVLTKYQRIKESVLLRTLGASRKQILWINAIEYFLLGSMAALTGMILSIIGSYLLAYYAFDLKFQPNWIPPILWFLGITALTLIIGLFNTREVLFKPPLEVLRNEV